MAKFVARLVIDLEDGSVALADPSNGEVQLHARSSSQLGTPFTSTEIEALAEMNSLHL